jgi:hypothetical protein
MPADKHARVLVNCPSCLILTKTGMSQHVLKLLRFYENPLRSSPDRHWKENMCMLVTLLAMAGGGVILVSCVSPDHSGTDQCKNFLHTNYYQLCLQTCAILMLMT